MTEAKTSPTPMTPAEREFSEKAKAYAEFIMSNRIYGFRLPNEAERAVEAAISEKLFLPPNPKQQLLLDAWFDSTKKVFTFTGGNRMGKTTIEVIIALSVLFGRTLWDDRPIKFPHRYPRKVRIVGQGWESHIKSVLIPKLKFWWPKNRPLDTKKNNQGVEAVWKDLATGSTLDIFSNNQDSKELEGPDHDLVLYDEPPKRDIRVACARGLVDRKGRELFCMTLLSEAWIHREVIKARLPDGSPDLSIFNVTGTIYDNQGYGLTAEGIEQFAKTLKPEERKARIDGQPSYLSTLVFPKFNRDLHVKQPFKIPLNWIVDFSIDFHPSKPWAVVALATAPNGFKYVCKEFQLRGGPKFVGEEIERYVRTNSLRVGKVTIDPLAKGDENADEEARTVYDKLSDVLSSFGINLEVASKDKDNGIQLVNDLLWTENEMPGLFFFSDCVNTIKQVEDLMYQEDDLKIKAAKVDDDYTECLYRLALLDTTWFPAKQFDISNQRSMML